MSATRHAKPGSPFRQERYASSGEFHQVLKANLVAKRAELVEDRELRELIWFIQYRSVRDLGLGALVQELVETYRSELGTARMREMGCGPDRIYNAEEVRKVRWAFRDQIRGLADDNYEPWHLLSDEVERREFPGGFMGMLAMGTEEGEEYVRRSDKTHGEPLRNYPESFPASSFVDASARQAMAGFEDRNSLDAFLTDLCLNPKAEFTGGPYYWPGVVPCLKDYRRRWCAAQGAGQVETEVNKLVASVMEYCLRERDGREGGGVVISGEARFGKTHSAQLFCERSGGMVRYVEVPATNDDATFLRAIGRSLGVASGLGIKLIDLRERIEETLARSDLALCLDEGHRMFPQRDFRQNIPQRLEWLMAGVINKGVNCAIVTTPQWFNAQRRIEERNFWNSSQLRGRIDDYVILPNQIPAEDMRAVARYLLPQACAKSLAYLVAAAEATETYLGGMTRIVARARFEAKGEPDLAALVKVADRFTASNTSLTRASLSAPRRGRRRVSNEVATPVQEPCTAQETPSRDGVECAPPAQTRGRGSDFELKLPSQRNRATGLVAIAGE